MDMTTATNTRNDKTETLLDKASGVLIALSVLILPLDTWQSAPAWLAAGVGLWERGVTWLFAVEYGMRIWLARRRLKYLTSFYGLLDAVTILPYFVAPWLGLQELRALRLLRLLRLAKAIRYTRTLRRFGQALTQTKGEAVVFLCATAVVLYVASIGIWYFEHKAQPEAFATVFHALWWAVVTLTTVGYGDMYPITAGGKIFTAAIAFVSLGVVAGLTGMVAAALTNVANEERDRKTMADDDNTDTQREEEPTRKDPRGSLPSIPPWQSRKETDNPRG